MKTTLTAEQKAKTMGREGYALSASLCIGLYEVWQPGNTHYGYPLTRAPYIIDTRDGEIRCNCPATVKTCKHIEFFARCRRFWLALEAREAAAGKPVRRHRLFNPKRLQKMAAPTMAGPVNVGEYKFTPEQRAAIRARIAVDFANAP